MNEIIATDIDQKLIRHLAKKYNPLEYREKLTQLLSPIYPAIDFRKWEKIKLHELVNNTVIGRDTSEQVLKYFLYQHFHRKKVVAAFEIKVNNSRADFLAINGFTKSFEIKSSLDNLYKLKKQTADYVLAFEENFLVIDEKHLESTKELAPECFGIWSFSKGGVKKIHRPALPNAKIDAEFQLLLLTKRELQQQFKEQEGIIPFILKEFKETEINERFKEALKRRYQKRWEFLLQHQHSIFPIDLQFFFNRNIEPKIIYHCYF